MTINHAELIEELQVAIDDLRALHVAKKNDMESITGFSADAIATLYETSRDRISTLTAEVEELLERLDELKVGGRPLRHMDIRLGLLMKRLRATLTKEKDETMRPDRYGVVSKPGRPERYRCFSCGKTQGDYLCCEACGRDPFSPKKGRANPMTNNPVELQDAIERIVEEIAVHDETRHEGMIGHGLVYVRADDLRTILAASHPLEQQQAVSGDAVERVARAIAYEFDIDADVFIGMHGRDKWEKQWHSIAHAALTASGMGTWQPIETAPKGVDRLLFYCPVVRKNLRTLREEPVGWVLGGSFDDGELFVDNSHGGGVPWKLTHWMPLPEPPRTALQEDPLDASRDPE